MVAILFPRQSAPGPYPQESSGRLINAWSGETQEGAGSVNIIRRVPGLRAFAAAGQTGPRGFKRVGNTLWAVYEDGIIKVSESGVVTWHGSIDGDAQPVDLALNNRTPSPQLVCVTSAGAFVITSAGVSPIYDPDLPQPNSVCEMDGYFIFSIADGRMFASGLNDITVNSLDFARAEARQGGLIRVVSYSGQLFAFKNTSCEVWSNTAEPTGFPFSRAAVIDRGLIAPRAIAGTQEGFATALIWVGDDGAVNTLDGYAAKAISTPDVERSISALPDKSELRAYVYTFDGQPIWSLSCSLFTWEYNLKTGVWHERQSAGLSRWRGSETVYFAGKWLCGDLSSTSLMEITSAANDEAGAVLVCDVESIQMGSFPRPYRVGKTQFDFSVGVGASNGTDPIQTNPVAMVSWSDDAGLTWSNPAVVPLGRQGEGRTQVNLPRQLGRTGPKGRRWRVRVSDPVRFGLFGGDMEVLTGRS